MTVRPKVAPGLGGARLAAAPTPALERYAASLERKLYTHRADLDHYTAYVTVQRVLRQRRAKPGS